MLSLKHLLGILCITISSVYCSGGGGGESTTFRKDHGNYKFGYDINDGKGGNNFHKEEGDEYGNKRGSYGILGPDGQMRIVHYIADEKGFRVDIKSNEVGLAEGKDSAAAIVNGKDIEEHPDYSSGYGQRAPGYAPTPLYLSSTSDHPSKPYYLNSLSAKTDDDHAYSPPLSYPSHEVYTAPKPKYYSPKYYAPVAKSYYPKNVAYLPKYHSQASYEPSYYPKPVAYEAPSYSSTYSSPKYGGTSSPPYSYEPVHYPTPVHKATYTAHDESPHSYTTAYEPSSYSVYGTRKTPYHAADLYSKSAEPILSYTKLSGYSAKKHNERTKYYNEPLEHLSSTAEETGVSYPKSPTPAPAALDTTDNLNTPKKRLEDEEVAAGYRDEPKNGVISTKALSPSSLSKAKTSKLVSGLIGLTTSYRNPYSIDTDYKSSKKKK